MSAKTIRYWFIDTFMDIESVDDECYLFWCYPNSSSSSYFIKDVIEPAVDDPTNNMLDEYDGWVHICRNSLLDALAKIDKEGYSYVNVDYGSLEMSIDEVKTQLKTLLNKKNINYEECNHNSLKVKVKIEQNLYGCYENQTDSDIQCAWDSNILAFNEHVFQTRSSIEHMMFY